MKKVTRIISLLLSLMLLASCGNSNSGAKDGSKTEDGVKVYSFFAAVAGTEVSDDNRMLNKIAEKIGAKADVTWLTGQTAEERIGVMIAGGEYPDLIDGNVGMLMDAEALIPIDEYWEGCDDLKALFSDADWNRIRQPDGHIYFVPQFGIIKQEKRDTTHHGEAFWIQKRVLEWDNYPTIKTLDQYFDLINRYLAANPANEDGTKNIGFEILCDDWRYFCLENPPQFLAGYPNDGKAVVDPVTLQAKVYDTLPEAEIYYGKLNSEYKKGTIDPETFTMNYDQYIAKISSGRVLGMVDQDWQFLSATNSLISQNMDDRTYVALDLVIDPAVTPHYAGPDGISVANGVGVTVSCDDPAGAVKFLNDLVSPDVMIMRYWGEEGVDYQVDENGLFYRTDEQRQNRKNVDWVNKNLVTNAYSYLPQYGGVLPDGKNSVDPEQQPAEYYASLREYDQKFLDAYGYETYLDFLTISNETSDWYPLWSYVNSWSGDKDYVVAWRKMDDVKKEWLPKIIMSDDYPAAWKEYMEAYHKEVDVAAYEKELTDEVARRIEIAERG